METVAHLAVYKTLPLTGLRLSDNLQKHVDGDLLEKTLTMGKLTFAINVCSSRVKYLPLVEEM